MKKIIVGIVVIVAAVAVLRDDGWQHGPLVVMAKQLFHTGSGKTGGPTEFMEARVDFKVPQRDIQMVFVAKVDGGRDCREGGKQMMARILEGCTGKCSANGEPTCSAKLAPRYSKVMDNEPIHVTYLSYDRADASEVDFRLVFWGLTEQEARITCRTLASDLSRDSQLRGDARCI